jgi:hypothetical protein
MADSTRGRTAQPVGGWLWLARVGWVLAALLLLGMDTLGTPALLRLARGLRRWPLRFLPALGGAGTATGGAWHAPGRLCRLYCGAELDRPLVFAQIYRFRRVSSAIERQQTKWVVFGSALGLGTFVALLVVGNVVLMHRVRDSEPGQLIANTVLTILLWCVPLSIGVAILRSRLWDIDVLINRALVYGSLTVALAALYLGVVVGLQALATALTGQPQPQPQPLVIVATTLLIAALVQPLRRALQHGIDRRFYRHKYDAARTLARFGATLRTETDLDQLSEHLVGVVDETMRPAHVALWLAHPATPRSQREGLG